MTENADVFGAKDKLMGDLGWEENPFVKDLRIYDKESFLKYYCPLDGGKVLERLAFDAKACMLVGPKGVGKTSALYYAYYNLPAGEYDIIMLKQPSADLTQLAAELGLRKGESALDGLFSAIGGLWGAKKRKETVSRQELVEFLRRRGRKLAVFVDEAHLAADPGMYMEFKYLLDEVPNLRMVFSSLSREGFPDSLVQLIGENNVFTRKGFSREEMLEIIAHRIQSVGGKETHPFSRGALDEILTEQNLLTPRYVFDELNGRLAEMALGKRKLAHEAVRLGHGDDLVQAAIASAKEAAGRAGREPAGAGKLTKIHADWWVAL